MNPMRPLFHIICTLIFLSVSPRRTGEITGRQLLGIGFEESRKA
jgi:hypothetical protein